MSQDVIAAQLNTGYLEAERCTDTWAQPAIFFRIWDPVRPPTVLVRGEGCHGRKRSRHGGGPQLEAPQRRGEESDVEDIDEGRVRVVVRSVDVLDD